MRFLFYVVEKSGIGTEKQLLKTRGITHRFYTVESKQKCHEIHRKHTMKHTDKTPKRSKNSKNKIACDTTIRTGKK